MKLTKEAQQKQDDFMNELVRDNTPVKLWIETQGYKMTNDQKKSIIDKGEEAWEERDIGRAICNEHDEELRTLGLPTNHHDLLNLMLDYNWEGVTVPIKQYLASQTCLVAIKLAWENENEPAIYPSDAVDVDWYEGFQNVLDYLQINPRMFSDVYGDGPGFPDMPERDHPIITPEQLGHIVDNAWCEGSMYALIELDLEWYVENFDVLQAECVIRKGTRIVQHNYYNGSTGGNAIAARDFVIKSPDIYLDETDRYGIQACCGLIRSAWTDGIDLITEQLEV